MPNNHLCCCPRCGWEMVNYKRDLLEFGLWWLLAQQTTKLLVKIAIITTQNQSHTLSFSFPLHTPHIQTRNTSLKGDICLLPSACLSISMEKSSPHIPKARNLERRDASPGSHTFLLSPRRGASLISESYGWLGSSTRGWWQGKILCTCSVWIWITGSWLASVGESSTAL